jgi:hypothetical protein
MANQCCIAPQEWTEEGQRPHPTDTQTQGLQTIFTCAKMEGRPENSPRKFIIKYMFISIYVQDCKLYLKDTILPMVIITSVEISDAVLTSLASLYFLIPLL